MSLKKLGYLLFRPSAIVALFALSACLGANPAVAPAPLVEIPSVFSVPKSVEVDVSLASAGKALGIASGVKAGSLDGEFSEAIAIGPDFAAQNNDTLEGFLYPFTQFVIPVDVNTRTFFGTIEEERQAFKFDFADYDFDGDGNLDGFTGCTCPVGCAPEVSLCPKEAPVTDLRRVGFRVWIQREPEEPFQPVMAGFFNVLPEKDDAATPVNEENPGSGTFRIGLDGGKLSPETGERFVVGVIYNHSDPAGDLNKTTESFGLLELSATGAQIDSSQKVHVFVSQLEKNDPAGKSYLEKTVKTRFDTFVAAGVEAPEELTGMEAYTGRFRDDSDFWSGSFLHLENDVPSMPPIPATCARISTGDGVLPDICIDLAIDTSNEDVTKGQTLSVVTEADVSFPADFPNTPTF